MIDDQHAATDVTQAADDAGKLAPLAVAGTGRRLVEQQEGSIGGSGARQIGHFAVTRQRQGLEGASDAELGSLHTRPLSCMSHARRNAFTSDAANARSS